MVRKYAQYYNQQQLNHGIRVEMSRGLDRATAERIARQNLSQSPKYYLRVQAMTPVFKQDRRTYRRKIVRKAERDNYSPFNQGSFFGSSL
jgi:hypothetical protein